MDIDTFTISAWYGIPDLFIGYYLKKGDGFGGRIFRFSSVDKCARMIPMGMGYESIVVMTDMVAWVEDEPGIFGLYRYPVVPPNLNQ